VNASQQVGGSIGVALLSTVAASAVTGQLAGVRATPALVAAATVHGYTTAFIWAAGIFVLGAAIAAALFRPPAPAGARLVPLPRAVALEEGAG
jgi:dipeptide/tripeptide permease